MLFLPRVRSLSGIVSFGKLSSVIAGVFSSLLLAMCHHGNPWLTELHEFDNDAAIVIERRHDTFEINLEVFALKLFILGIGVLRVVGKFRQLLGGAAVACTPK